jgi:peptide chain release factor 1
MIEKMAQKVSKILERRETLEKMLNDSEIFTNRQKAQEVGREFREINLLVPKCREFLQVYKQMNDDKEVINSNEDAELREFAKEELSELELKLDEIIEELKVLLVPKDPMDGKNAILEIRAGTGGDEAGIFAADLYRMYIRYIERAGFKIEEMDTSEVGIGGGLKEIIVLVKGEGAYGKMKFESGVHRVQRVPQTEASGRIHTSAATVAVLPEIEEFDFEIDPNDVRVDTFCSSGPGGQSVNTTYSAIRLTHIPTGTVGLVTEAEKSGLTIFPKAELQTTELT